MKKPPKRELISRDPRRTTGALKELLHAVFLPEAYHSWGLLLASLGFLVVLSGCSSRPSKVEATGEVMPTVPALGPTSTEPPVTPTDTPLAPTRTLVPIPTISEEDWSRGSIDAPISILVYSDFQ